MDLRIRCWCGMPWEAEPWEHQAGCVIEAVGRRGGGRVAILKTIAGREDPCDWGTPQGAIFDALASAPRDRAMALAGKLYLLRAARARKGVYVEQMPWLEVMRSQPYEDWAAALRGVGATMPRDGLPTYRELAARLQYLVTWMATYEREQG